MTPTSAPIAPNPQTTRLLRNIGVGIVVVSSGILVVLMAVDGPRPPELFFGVPGLVTIAVWLWRRHAARAE